MNKYERYHKFILYNFQSKTPLNRATEWRCYMTEQQAAKVHHIWCSATINKKMEDVLVSYICEQSKNTSELSEYVVYLSTLGGNPSSAISLYNFIKSSHKTLSVSLGMEFSLNCAIKWLYEVTKTEPLCIPVRVSPRVCHEVPS